MAQDFVKYIDELFEKLIKIFGFNMKTEINESQSYVIEFSSKKYVIKIEKYFREFYASIYRINEPNNGVNLFNLLGYLKQDVVNVPKSEYFRKEKDIEECYRKQLNHISSVIYENYDLINDFFSGDNYKLKMDEFEKYWKTKHPELYKMT